MPDLAHSRVGAGPAFIWAHGVTSAELHIAKTLDQIRAWPTMAANFLR